MLRIVLAVLPGSCRIDVAFKILQRREKLNTFSRAVDVARPSRSSKKAKASHLIPTVDDVSSVALRKVTDDFS